MIARYRPVGQRLPVCRMPGLGPKVVSESQALAAPCLPRDSISKILDAAEELFAQFGSEAVSVSDVAKLAGVSKSNIFHHFNSKHDLYIAVLDRARRAFYSLIEQLGSGRGDIQQRLRHYADRHLDAVLENDRTARLLLRDLLEHAPERNRCLAEEVFGSNFSSLVAIIRDSQIRGGLRKGLDPAMAATMILAANLFYFQGRDLLKHFRDVDFAEDPAHFSEGLMDILLYGILPRQSETPG